MNKLELLIIARKKIRQKNQWSVWSRVSVNTNLVLMTVKSVAESCSHDNILNFDNVVFKRNFLEYERLHALRNRSLKNIENIYIAEP